MPREVPHEQRKIYNSEAIRALPFGWRLIERLYSN